MLLVSPLSSRASARTRGSPLVALLLVGLLTGCGAKIASSETDDGGPSDTGSPSVTSDAGKGAPPVADASPVIDATAPADAAPACTAGPSAVTTSTSCLPEDKLRAQAASECGAKGLATFTAREPCGGLFRYRTFTCCAAGGGPCDPPRLDGSDSSCKDVGTWRSYSASDCATEGKVLDEASFLVSEPCGGTAGYLSAVRACCGG